MGCVAIWPVTVPSPRVQRHREVAVLALPVENSLNPGIKAPSVDEAVDGKSGSVPSMSCTIPRVLNTQWMTTDKSMSHSNWNSLVLDRLRWRKKKKQKTEKVLC